MRRAVRSETRSVRRVTARACACSPTFYVFVHQSGKLSKEKVGKNEKVAKRKRDKLQVQEDEGTFEALKNIKFSVWADQWTASLERKSTTLRLTRRR
jgi:hypothetical protein